MPRLELGTTTLHYQDTLGGGPALLLLHAFPLHSDMWSRQLAELAGLRLIAPDFRGFGHSPAAAEPATMSRFAQDALELCTALAVERAIVVGLSMGGYVAFELHRQAPALFRGLVLCDTRAGADTVEVRAQREAFAQSTLERGLGWVADEMTPRLLGPSAPAACHDRVRALIAAASPAGVAAAQRGMAERANFTDALSTVRCPTLVMVGAEDRLTPPSEAAALARGISGARLVEIPGAGHLPCLENPAAFNRELGGFCRALDP